MTRGGSAHPAQVTDVDGEGEERLETRKSGWRGREADLVSLSLQSLNLRNKEGWKGERERERVRQEFDGSIPLAKVHVTQISC